MNEAAAELALLLATVPVQRRQAIIAVLVVIGATADASGTLRTAIDLLKVA